MRVLVTRPEPASAKTAAALECLGHAPVLLPLMQATHQLDVFASAPLPRTTALAVTSAEAMRALEACPKETSRPFLSLPVFAVGHATAQAAHAAGFEDVSVADGDGRSLAKRLIATRDPEAKILYLTGTPRSPDFEAALADAGCMVEIRECYRMSPLAYQESEIAHRLTPMPDAILVYSSETARRLGELHDRMRSSLEWQRTRFLCLSEKIANALPEEFQRASQWPLQPREDLLLLLL